MLKTDYVNIVAVPVGGEFTMGVLTGHATITRHVKRIICDIVANAAAIIYIDTDRVALIDTAILPALAPFIDVDIDLPAGERLNIGYRDLAAAGHANLSIGFQWEEG